MSPECIMNGESSDHSGGDSGDGSLMQTECNLNVS